MEETLTMSNREIDRLKMIHQVLGKKITWSLASLHLGLSMRQVGRLCARVRDYGNRGLIHGLRGQPSNHQLDAGLMDKALEIIQGRYSDFGPTFANEKLAQRHNIHISTFALRTAMVQAGIWRAKEHKPKHRAWRERRPCLGMLLQLDGSDHDWFEGRGPKCALLTFIDDATSRVLYGVFIPVENTHYLLAAVKAYLLLHGRPLCFYVDKDSIYKVNRQATIEEELRDDHPLTQFSRAMKELDIEIIFALSPQAKGRVERGFKTHQDRLVKELRLAGISNIKKANPFLQTVYFPQHNERFAVAPQDSTDAHKPLLASHNLEEILSLRTQRTLLNDWTLRFKNQFFQLLADQPIRIKPKDRLTVEIRLDGSAHLRFKDHYLSFKTLDRRPYHSYFTLKPLQRTNTWVPGSLGYARLVHISP